MDKKISLDLAEQTYYIQIPCTQEQTLCRSVFAYDVLLKMLVKHDDIKLLGYCLFPSEMHLLLHSEKAPSKWLEPWLMDYNQWHQETSNSTGYLFDDEQTKLILIQPKNLCKTLRHIHYLPQQKKLCSAPEQYFYSSYHDYTGEQDTGVDIQTISAILSPHFGQRLRRFYDYMAVANQEPNDVFTLGNHQYYCALADEHYLTKARSSYQTQANEVSESQHLVTWQSCIDMLVESQGIEAGYWLGLQRHHSLPDAHFILAWAFVKVANAPVYVCAKQLGIDETTLKLKINSIHLHHPAKYLRYIEESWNSTTA